MKNRFLGLLIVISLALALTGCEQPANETIKEVTTINNIPIIWKGSLPEAPSNPSIGWAYYNTSLKAAFIWNERNWEILAQDGVSIIWKGELPDSPSNPQLNWAYYNVIDGNSYIYSGSKWDLLAKAGRDGASGILLWIGTLATAPLNPMEGWAYYNSTDGISYIWNGSNWGILAKDGQNGTDGVDGIGIVWCGALASPPASPQINWAYYDTSNSKSYIWDGYSWQIMAESGNTVFTVPFTWKGTLTSAPFDPQTGWMYYNSVLGKTYIWDGTSWEIVSQDGQPGQDGNYPEGFLITWQGGLASAPINPQKGWAYYDSSQKKSLMWDGSIWQILAQDGADGTGNGETEDKEINGDGINYIAVQIVGIMDKISSEYIVLTFDESISDLDISDIQLIADTGEATFYKVSGDNKSWRIDLSDVLIQGIVKVKITKEGIDSGQKPVFVYKKNVVDNYITYIAIQEGGSSDIADSKQIVLTFDAPVSNLPRENVIYYGNTTGIVVEQDVIGSGKSWFIRLSSVINQGTVNFYLSNTGYMSEYNGLPFDTSVKTIQVYKDTTYGITGSLNYVISEDGVLTISGTGEIPNYSSIGSPWYGHRNSIKSIQLGENVTRIGNYAFYGTAAEYVIGLGITEIGNNAFGNCGSLVNIDLPLVTNIGNYAFQNCSSLESFDFPLVTTIGSNAFEQCSSLESVDFPLVTNISSSAFRQCSSLESFDFPLVTTIGSNAFEQCSSLESVDFPLVTNISSFAFRGCSSLESVDFPLVTSIGSGAFSQCSSLESFDFPLVTNISNSAFSGCSSLESVDFPLVTTIGNNAFQECSSLESVDFPLVTTIGSNTFWSCSSLESVNIPQVESLGRYVFEYTGTNTLTITMGYAAPTLDIQIFFGITAAKTIIVQIPSGATGYSPASSPFDGTTVTVSGSDISNNWGNGLRGGGWTGTTYITSTSINQNITLIIQEE